MIDDTGSSALQRAHQEVDHQKRERDHYEAALTAIALHHDMPAGESWEQAYNEVCEIAREALDA